MLGPFGNYVIFIDDFHDKYTKKSFDYGKTNITLNKRLTKN